MTRTHAPQPAAGGPAAHRVRALARTVSRYVLPFVASLSVAALWLMLMSIVTDATGSSLLVLGLAILPGAVIMAVSRTERKHWVEYVLVWIGFFTAVPLYGVMLLIGGYGIVLARAWHRHPRRRTEHPVG